MPPAAQDRPVPSLPAAAPGGSLVERLREGDAQAMAEILSTCLDRVYGCRYRRTGSWSAATGAG